MSGELSLDSVSPTQTSKETTINAVFAEIEASIAGVLVVDCSAGNGAVSATQAKRNSVVRIAGNTVARTVTFSPTKRLLTVKNTGSAAVTLTVGSTTSSLGAGAATVMYMDGTTNGLEVLALGGAIATTNLTDVDESTPPTTNQFLRWNAGTSKWIPWSWAVSTQTANYTLVLGDAASTLRMNVATANTLTIPPNSSVAFPIGSEVEVIQAGAGLTTITAGAGVTLNTPSAASTAQHQRCFLRKTATDTWNAVWMAAAGGGGGATALSGLSDVNVTEGSGIDGKYLKWNDATSKWIPDTPAGGVTTYTDPYGAHAYWYFRMTTDQGSNGQSIFAGLEFHAQPGGADLAYGSGGTPLVDSGGNISGANGPDKLFDNNSGTVWGSGSSTLPHRVGFHFPTPVHVQEIAIFATGGGTSFATMPIAGDVMYSDDGTTFTTAFSISTGVNWTSEGEKRVFTSPDISIGGGIGSHRYWMIDNVVSTTQNTDTPTSNTMELRASAGGAAQIPTAYGVHSDYFSSSTAADKLFDGSDSTGCSFKYLNIRNFFTLDMGSAKAVREIYLKSRNDGFNHQNWEVFDVLYSDDNKVFTKVCSIVTSDDGSATASYTFTLPA